MKVFIKRIYKKPYVILIVTLLIIGVSIFIYTRSIQSLPVLELKPGASNGVYDRYVTWDADTEVHKDAKIHIATYVNEESMIMYFIIDKASLSEEIGDTKIVAVDDFQLFSNLLAFDYTVGGLTWCNDPLHNLIYSCGQDVGTKIQTTNIEVKVTLLEVISEDEKRYSFEIVSGQAILIDSTGETKMKIKSPTFEMDVLRYTLE